MLPDAEENLLGDVLGVAGVSQHLGDGAHNRMLVSLDQLAEGLVVTCGDPGHEGVIDSGFTISRSAWVGFLHRVADG